MAATQRGIAEDQSMIKPFEGNRVGVLMGGASGEREVSLRSGKGVLDSLTRQGYDAVGIDVGADVAERLRAEKVEVAYIALHGKGGEDGSIQGLLETMRVPYTGSGVAASAVAMDKELTKLVFRHRGVPVLEDSYPDRSKKLDECCAEAIAATGLPAIVKPLSEGSSLGVEIARDERALRDVVGRLVEKFGRAMVERFVSGREITVGVLGCGESLRALPVLELVPKNEFYDFEAKYTKGMTELICPARLDAATTERAMKLAVAAHRALGCHGVSRVDFIVAPDGDMFALELNSIPGMTPTSDLPEEIAAEGGSYDTLVLEILSSASLSK